MPTARTELLTHVFFDGGNNVTEKPPLVENVGAAY